MKLLDEITIPHKSGTKRIQLFHGDLTKLPEEHAVDILIVSAWQDSYEPVEGTLVAALEKKGVSVKELAGRNAVEPDIPGSASSFSPASGNRQADGYC